MKSMPREAWRYAVLLIVLFAIATVTVHSILAYLSEGLTREHFNVVTVLMFSLTLGFMLIAGAFGLWAVRFSAEAESRRRIGRFVDAMDYLSDGLITLDAKARIRAANPAACEMTESASLNGRRLREVFPSLTEDDRLALVRQGEPYECESRHRNAQGVERVYRFRSQPSDGLALVMISDITAMNAQATRNRQAARLQLIGQIARGVAHDFSELLCEVSAQASLIERVPGESVDAQSALRQILRNADKGVRLAAQLRDLAYPVSPETPTDDCVESLALAAERVRDSLPADWKVQTQWQPVGPIALTGIQIEQIVVNLALLGADSWGRIPGLVRIETHAPCPQATDDAPSTPAGAVQVTVRPQAESNLAPAAPAGLAAEGESGVILSVIRSMIADAGGTFDARQEAGSAVVYRIGLPPSLLSNTTDDVHAPVRHVEAALARWRILLALPARHSAGPLCKRLKAVQADIRETDNAIAVLAQAEKDEVLDAIVVDGALLHPETEGLLRALLKLHPGAGIVALGRNDESVCAALAQEVVFVATQSDPDPILLALVEAKNLAAHRRSA
jgi:PAS domain-containing protein